MKKIQPIDCEQALSRIFELIDHELKGTEREAMEQHLHTCKSCFSRVEFERRLKAKLKALHDEETSTAARVRLEKLLKAL
jgi:anti-sigma factor (TIGR02949 family)